ncbi:MAG: hypothetical protein K0R25_818 [Rickettsiaceae bacterium]|jgi:ascorbate-specific PTS system EIIC-type component UlaA|nr:hypothetical protein [Rickettsiaceae bacterium]
MNSEAKKNNKSLIFLKSSVIALGIVFMVLFVVLIFAKQKKSVQKSRDCQDFLQLKILGEVEKMELQGSNIIILTKRNSKTGKQEIVKIDGNCTSVISRIELSQ